MESIRNEWLNVQLIQISESIIWTAFFQLVATTYIWVNYL